MRWALWCYGVLACVASRTGYFDLLERRGHLRRCGSEPVGLICQTAWQPTKRSDPCNGSGLSLAENHLGPADPLLCHPGGWNSAADAGNHGCRPATRGRADRSSSCSNGRQSRHEGRKSLCGLLHPYTFWEKDTKSYENEKLLLPTGWHVESGRHPGATSIPGVASLFQGVPSSFIHAALQCNSGAGGRGASERNSRHGDKETIGCSASLPREILRGLQRALSGVPGMLALADGGRYTWLPVFVTLWWCACVAPSVSGYSLLSPVVFACGLCTCDLSTIRQKVSAAACSSSN